MNAYQILHERGFFYQLTDDETVKQRLEQGSVTFYVGIDPTASSMHVGHLLFVMGARWLQQCGHHPIILVGGGTAMVGDPSGKTDMRQMLSQEQIADNAQALTQQLSRYLDFSPDSATLVNNIDWLGGLGCIEFLRETGVHFSVNRMLTAESVRQRLENGISYLEFSYSLLQAYDFYVLARDYECDFQFGGQDQWGNIVAGIDLVRRRIGKATYGATFPLLTDAQNRKFGKSVDGAVWLDAERTSVFDFYQFWRNVDDVDVERLLAFFTTLPMDEVQRLGQLPAPSINRAKEILAYEVTSLAHGADLAATAYRTATGQFGHADASGEIATTSAIATLDNNPCNNELPTFFVDSDAIAGDGIWIVTLFVQAGLEASNGAARRLISGGGAYLNDQRISDCNRNVTIDDFTNNELLLRAGKKKIRRVVIKATGLQ